MSSELIQSKSISSHATLSDAKSAMLKAASRFGKSYIAKDGEVVVRPRTTINRMKITTEAEENRSGGSVVTYTGKIRPSPVGVIMIVLVMIVLLVLAWWASLIAAFIVLSINKKAEKGLVAVFNDTTKNAMEALS